MDGRRATGGQLEVIFRLRKPLLKPDIRIVKYKKLVFLQHYLTEGLSSLTFFFFNIYIPLFAEYLEPTLPNPPSIQSSSIETTQSVNPPTPQSMFDRTREHIKRFQRNQWFCF